MFLLLIPVSGQEPSAIPEYSHYPVAGGDTMEKPNFATFA
jgi:hypothetical protein